jgi:trehalose 6-phosphate phosphatase
VWRRLERVKGVRIENKGAAVAVHVRGASKSDIAQAERAVQAVARRLPQLEILRGKKILELVPSGGTDKWHAVQTILHRENAQGIPVFFLGDDTTDESVFRKLGGFSIAVGKRRKTAAKFFLRSLAEVRKFLERISQVP